MRQAIMTAPGRIEFREVPAPAAGPGQVLLRISRIGICGSDVHVNHGRHPYTRYPVVQGHEFSGYIQEVGAGVVGLRQGMLVTAMPQVVCGRCPPCQRGDYHICDNLRVMGFQAAGCAQDLLVVDADKIIPLPQSFTCEQGAMVEPAAVAVHAVGRTGGVEGKNVVVFGAGPIGNLVAQVARAGGAQVLITDLGDYRLEVARQCGLPLTANLNRESLSEAVKRSFGPQGFSVALECVGVERTVAAAIECMAKGGTLVVVGVFAEKPRVDLGRLQDRELRIVGTMMYKREDYLRAVELISTGTIKTEPMQSRHFAFEQFAEAYRLIDREGEKCVKLFVDVM